MTFGPTGEEHLSQTVVASALGSCEAPCPEGKVKRSVSVQVMPGRLSLK